MKLRFKITSTTCPSNVQYLVINKGKAQLFTQQYKRLHISQLCNNPAELMFALEDATTADEVQAAIAKHCGDGKEVKAL